MKVFPILGEGFSSNIYVVMGKRNLLVDAGLGLEVERVIEKIEGYLGNKKLDAVILTHRHMDHIGGAGAIARHFNAKVYSSKSEARAVNGRDGRSTCAYAFGMQIPEVTVLDIDDLRLEEMEVIPTPGHTEGSISLYFPAQKWLFSGDTVFLYGSTGRWDLPTGNLAQLIESIQSLENLEIVGLFPGHEGYAEANGKDHIVSALEFLRGAFLE
ncbi:MAG: MBL fold metallo-hydrolase [Thermoplasmata archaeon]|nr:MBL fold metallo-hydrolase [Thermoplasmata archaeon]